MDYYDLLLAKKLGGGGGSATLIEKSVNANGVYNAADDEADGYSKVTVNVPNPSTGSISITENGTYDVTEKASAVVNVPPSGWTTDGLASGAEPNGSITISSSVEKIVERAFYKRDRITSVTIQGSPYVENYVFANCNSLASVSLPNVTKLYSSYNNVAAYLFQNCTALTVVVLPSHGAYNTPTYMFDGCTSLHTFDIKNCNNLGSNFFKRCSSLRTLILRRTDSVMTTAGSGNQQFGGIYDNPNDSVIYVPESLLASYRSASNWVNLYNLNNNIFQKIEGTTYETHYADGTVIA